MFIYNTLSQKKEELKEENVRLFVCGPTVYDYIHIGNARVYVFFDIFVRYLRSLGKKVQYLQNITDLDDKIILRAEEERVSPQNVAKRFTKAFFKNINQLGVISVDTYAPATDFIPQIQTQIKKLIEKKHAYKIEGDGWYFDLTTFPDYGKLSKRTVEQAEDGMSRIDENPKKRNRGDFCLWKFSKPGEPVWKVDFGDGRPGWHIEDTAISEHFFGPQYEVHGAGADLMFPHHEAEIAQEESVSGKKPMVKLWMHAGMLSINGKKMSKSIGNVVSAQAFLKNYSANLFRFLVLTHHYRSSFDYNPNLLEENRKALERLTAFLGKLKFGMKGAKRGGGEFPILYYKENLEKELKDDFNTPGAIGVLFELLNHTDKSLWDLSLAALENVHSFLSGALGGFGLDLNEPRISLKARWLAWRREKLRASQQFAQADKLRKKVDTLGYVIEDTPRGPFLWPKRLS